MAIKKPELRKKILSERRALSNREELSKRIWALLRTLPEYQSAGTIFAYIGMRDEVSTLEPLREESAQGKRIALPTVVGAELHFTAVHDFTQLEIGSYGILEPSELLRSEPALQCSPAPGDLILVPGLCFTTKGARLGFGAGYYDRFLASQPPQLTKVGLVFHSLIVQEIPEESHDVRIDILVSDTDITRATSLEKSP